MSDPQIDNMLAFFEGEQGRRRMLSILLKSNLVRSDTTIAYALMEVGELCVFPAGAAIITEGEDGDDIYFFLRGKADILVDGVKVRDRSATQADHVGEMALADPSCCRSATVLTTEPTAALMVSAAQFITLADAHPKLWRELVAELANRIRQRNEHTKATKNGPVISPHAPNWKQVVQLLERVPAGLRRWTWEEEFKNNREPRKWYIDNEYHVQSLLYTILAPHFPDILEENSTDTIGHKHPRFDLFIPLLNLIIEVKFLRSRTSFATLEGEIAEDATFYRSVAGGEDRKIIAFIWDDSCRVQEHDLLKRGVRQMVGINDVIVVSRPGNFVESQAATLTNSTASGASGSTSDAPVEPKTSVG